MHDLINHHQGYPKSSVTALKNLGKMQERIADLRKPAQDCEELIQQWIKDGHEWKTDINVSFWFACMHYINLSCMVDSMEDVAEILRALGRYGYSQTADVEENPIEQKRTYHLGLINLEIGFKGTVCKYVEIGTETVEKKLYEMRCDKPEETLT